MEEAVGFINNNQGVDEGGEIEHMPSSSEKPHRKKSKSKKGRGAKSRTPKMQANAHHRKNSSINDFENFKGVLRNELLSIDFAEGENGDAGFSQF